MSMAWASLLLIGALVAEPPTPSASPPVWQVDHGENFCSVIHRPRADPSLTVVVRMVPRAGAADLLFSRADGAQPSEPPRDIRIRIDGSVLTDDGERGAFSHARPDGAPLIGVRMPRSVIDQFLTGHRVSMVSDGTTILDLAPPASARPQQALETCEKALISEWGFDPEQPPAVIRRPELIWDSGDYPFRAMMEGRSGGAYFLAAVQPNGRVAECRILISSGTPELDEATCRGMQRSGRFETFEGPPRIHVSATIWRVQR